MPREFIQRSSHEESGDKKSEDGTSIQKWLEAVDQDGAEKDPVTWEEEQVPHSFVIHC